jgi:hypothetical protein
MVIGRTSGVHPAVLTVPELPSSRAFMPAMAAVTVLSHGRPHAQTGFNWRLTGEICLQPNAQDGRNAGHGAYDVTDNKFSTQMGPHSCSPPV